MKKCTKCREEKNHHEFNKHSKTRDGLTTYCKKCLNLYSNTWQKANKDKRQAVAVTYRKAHPDKCNALCMKRIADKLKRTPKWLTQEQLREIESFYTIAHDLSWLSEGGLEVDHIIPLRGKNVSGLHVPWNLQVIPTAQNRAKSNKLS